jgi:hypothetical protein
MTTIIWIVVAVVLGLISFAIVTTGPYSILFFAMILPLVSAVIACVGFWLIAMRLHAGVWIALFFCIPILVVGLLQTLPSLLQSRVSFMTLGNLSAARFWLSPLLILLASLALLFLAGKVRRLKDMGQGVK